MSLELGSRAGDNTSDESTYERAVPEGSEMFSRPVVFIVGAGASAEFRMPAGGELKTKVAAAVNFGAAGTRHTGDQDLYKLLTSYGSEQIDRLRQCRAFARRRHSLVYFNRRGVELVHVA